MLPFPFGEPTEYPYERLCRYGKFVAQLSSRDTRIGLNEAVFREVNERINRIQEDFGQTQAFEIVCECGSQGCLERITLTHDAYRELRANPRTFAIVPGHEAEDVEHVLERYEGYYIVEKKEGLPAAIAESDQ